MEKSKQMLKNLAESAKTNLCFGIDPSFEKLKGTEGEIGQRITNYYFEITDLLIKEGQISAIKPNYAFFAQYGFEGIMALKSVISRYKNQTFVILDAKRGDIGKTGLAYAKEAYDFFGAHAVTVSPYMGTDSVAPFVREDKLAYVLCRTSNEGAKDFQEQQIGSKKLYELVAQKSIVWKTGLVVGATSDAIADIAKMTKNQTPLLIPGIGSQGGDLDATLKAIKTNPAIHRINASSSIAFAYEKRAGLKPAKAALEEATSLNEKIRKYF
ncbi:MAG: orotidine-5'-phosphate decarboxylase [Candidatus Micrarchaeota archaeon]